MRLLPTCRHHVRFIFPAIVVRRQDRTGEVRRREVPAAEGTFRKEISYVPECSVDAGTAAREVEAVMPARVAVPRRAVRRRGREGRVVAEVVVVRRAGPVILSR